MSKLPGDIRCYWRPLAAAATTPISERIYSTYLYPIVSPESDKVAGTKENGSEAVDKTRAYISMKVPVVDSHITCMRYMRFWSMLREIGFTLLRKFFVRIKH